MKPFWEGFIEVFKIIYDVGLYEGCKTFGMFVSLSIILISIIGILMACVQWLLT